MDSTAQCGTRPTEQPVRAIGYRYAKVTQAELPSVWLQVRPLLDSALATSRGEANPEHFRRTIEKGQMDLFVTIEDTNVIAILITQFIAHANYTALRVCIMAGATPLVLDDSFNGFWPTITKWAKERGATKVEAYCHAAMARLLQQKYGFGERYSVVVLELEK